MLHWLATQRLEDLKRVSIILPRDEHGRFRPIDQAVLNEFSARLRRAVDRMEIAQQFDERGNP